MLGLLLGDSARDGVTRRVIADLLTLRDKAAKLTARSKSEVWSGLLRDERRGNFLKGARLTRLAILR